MKTKEALAREWQDYRNTLETNAKRGGLTNTFLGQNFYLDYLKPYLEGSITNIALQSAALPNAVQETEKIAILAALNAGQIKFIRQMMADLNAWAKEGQEAQKKLIEMEEEKK